MRASLTRPASKYDLMTFVARNEGGLGENGELKWVEEGCGRELGNLGVREEGRWTSFLDLISYAIMPSSCYFRITQNYSFHRRNTLINHCEFVTTNAFADYTRRSFFKKKIGN